VRQKEKLSLGSLAEVSFEVRSRTKKTNQEMETR